jgi:hypothetical protein
LEYVCFIHFLAAKNSEVIDPLSEHPMKAGITSPSNMHFPSPKFCSDSLSPPSQISKWIKACYPKWIKILGGKNDGTHNWFTSSSCEAKDQEVGILGVTPHKYPSFS